MSLLTARSVSVALLVCAASLLLRPPEGDEAVRWLGWWLVLGACALLLLSSRRLHVAPVALGVALVVTSVGSLVLLVVAQRTRGLLGPWYVEMLLAVAVVVCAAVAAGYPGLVAGGGAAAGLLIAASSAPAPADLLQRTPFAVVASVAQVLVIGVGVAAALRMLDRATREADVRAAEAMSAMAERRAREKATADQLELQRTLHDTALNTLEAVAHHGDHLDPRLVAPRCEADAVVLDRWLAARGSSSPAAWADALADELRRARALGLRVTVEDSVAAAASHGLPIDVVAALAGAVRESLLNVSKHSGVDDAAITGAVTATHADVQVHDDGGGFSPSAAGAGGGLAESVAARLRQVGGSADVRSAAGRGTTVALTWSAPEREESGRSSTWTDRFATILVLVSVGVIVVDGLLLVVGWESWSRHVPALLSWALPLCWLLWLWRARARGERLGRQELIASLAVYVASALLEPVADPYCVVPLGELSGADGRLLMLATVLVLIPSRTALAAASATVAVVSIVGAATWNATWPLCGAGSLVQGLLGVVVLFVVRGLAGAIDSAAEATDRAVETATAARAEARRQSLLAVELASWTTGALRSVAELLDEVARRSATGSPITRDEMSRCGRLAQTLRAVLAIGVDSAPLQQGLRHWLGSVAGSDVTVTVRGCVSEIRPPHAVAVDVLHLVRDVEIPADVVLMGWRDGPEEGLIATVTPASPDTSVTKGRLMSDTSLGLATLALVGPGPAEIVSRDWVWSVESGT